MKAIILQEKPYEILENDEIWFNKDEILIVYHPQNHSLHFLDSDTNLKIFSSALCKSRNHAIEIFKNLT